MESSQLNLLAVVIQSYMLDEWKVTLLLINNLARSPGKAILWIFFFLIPEAASLSACSSFYHWIEFVLNMVYGYVTVPFFQGLDTYTDQA
jgi:hypothetical protein